jgi:penicillin amidase
LILLLVILIVASAGGYIYLRQSLPQTSGRIALAGPEAPVEIIRDIDAIPHIYAQSKPDALFALGYVHAQDRLWQMEFQRRVGQGRLSEIFGTTTIGIDRFLRTIGTYRAAQSAWQTLNADSRQGVEAYISGVNAYIDTHRGSGLPPEFTILWTTPEPWTGPDVLVWVKMMAWDLGHNFEVELARTGIVRAVGSERARDLLSPYAQDTPSGGLPDLGASDYSQLTALNQQIRALLGETSASRDGLGSNNWVISGARSTTGHPVLANDPHLGSRLPSIWYLAHLSYGDTDVIGASVPGLPGIVVGSNQSIAWGVTNAEGDVQDLFRERLDPAGQMAEFRGAIEPLQVITETIKVKGQPDIEQRVRISRHGPLISDALIANEQELPAAERQSYPEPLAFRWTALDAEDHTITAFMRINDARSWEEFKAALRLYTAPTQNFVYADTAGNIGYYVPGRFPIRAGGDGSLPAEGWSGAYEWSSWVPFEDLPQRYNPPEGFIVTANQQPFGGSGRYFLGQDWTQPYRAQRIAELIQAKQQLSPEDHAAIQADTTSPYARRMLPYLLERVQPQNDQQRQALDLLKSWDASTRGDSVAATIFAAWSRRLPRALAGDELGKKLVGNYEWRFSFTSRYLERVLPDADSPWCDIVTTPAAESCADVLQAELQAALDELEATLGSDISRWRWDRLHLTVFTHQPFESVYPLNRIFNRTIPNGGDSSTINVAPYDMQGPYMQYVVPGYRQIVTLGQPDGSRFIQAIGQSGHLLSAHYDDYLTDWQAVRYRPMRRNRAAVTEAGDGTLQLVPSQP